MELLQIGIEKGLIALDGTKENITYIHQNKKRKFTNPEEQVQAETYLKLVLLYNYPVKRIELFKPVTMASTIKEADIVIYNNDECTQPFIIVECKKADISELEFAQAIKQAASYAYALSGTIKYLWITSSIKNEYFLIDKDSDVRQIIPDIPRYGVKKIENYKFVVGGRKENEEAGDDPIKQRFFELKTISEDELTRRFKQAHNSLWAGGELNPSEAFDELDKLIFCKIWDERKYRNIGEPYDFQIFNESIPKNATKEQSAKIENKITQELYKRIINLYAEGKEKDPEVFRDDIKLTPQKVKTVVGYLESVNLSETDLDSKGKAFETFMGAYFRGDFGQYFTPRKIVKFIVNVLPITNESKVLDTSCGSGGFLLYALDKVRKQAGIYFPNQVGNPSKGIPEGKDHYKFWHDFAEKNLYGIEINEQIARTAKMNMIIHDDGHTNVISADGLLKPDALYAKSDNRGFLYGTFNFIITNPPFGSSVKQNEKAYLHQYRLGNKDVSWLDIKNSAVKERENQNTEVLFIEQCWNFLCPNGFLAIILPDGVLTNSSLQYVRDNIEEWFRIVAVISLPQTAFSHTGTGVKSSILFLRKWSNQTTEYICNFKKQLQEEIKIKNNYLKVIDKLDKEKKKTIKGHLGFINNINETDKKTIEKTIEFQSWKKMINEKYNEKLNDLKEELIDQYISLKSSKLFSYPIFMAIAEDIGYDSSGKPTDNNELDIIEEELKRFIDQIIKETNYYGAF